jgi:hypothetical protein
MEAARVYPDFTQDRIWDVGPDDRFPMVRVATPCRERACVSCSTGSRSCASDESLTIAVGSRSLTIARRTPNGWHSYSQLDCGSPVAVRAELAAVHGDAKRRTPDVSSSNA